MVPSRSVLDTVRLLDRLAISRGLRLTPWETKVRHHLASVLVLAVIASGDITAEADAASRSNYQTYSEASQRRGHDWRHQAYPRPGCTYAIQEYQRRWPYQLWPPVCGAFLIPIRAPSYSARPSHCGMTEHLASCQTLHLHGELRVTPLNVIHPDRQGKRVAAR